MQTHPASTSLGKDGLFRGSLTATVLALLACLSTHVLGILGVAGAVAWFTTLEHALLVAVPAFAALTVYAVLRHRRCRHPAQ
ncbi:hypothetical protein QNA08_18820 [Chelatococcus sp. SYSU_G07232]|uniref:Mercury resistance system transport protein MerF n=1 Tax=Chelatococcus albus TaxID=3047466 RepID=A0ABT7AN82_9HYPH|nr:hypothetical protein [Chelatococcus sp. SYSU_G07232]MDJ1160269.1 hypothetical protein [Chelatococcus sp. SYSU_G07232]